MARALLAYLLRLPWQRFMVFVLFAVVVVAVNGCTQRRPDNPFISPYSTSTPFGE